MWDEKEPMHGRLRAPCLDRAMLQSAEMQTVLVHPLRNIEISKLKKGERGRGETYIYLPS
jgi:hypothetical protein